LWATAALHGKKIAFSGWEIENERKIATLATLLDPEFHCI
jgi:hypothetical protein